MVLPSNTTAISTSMAIANVMDNKPMANILPFGMCSSLANPTVTAATTAARGMLTPMPCVPAIAGPWVPGSTTMLIGGLPALNDSSKCMCPWGGIISIIHPGQIPVEVP
ncbi:DUF4280 domain-containing protein [Oscillibacter sp.]|uniref:DUF4280 domain-containing protein n=1 Tax=Oscillibacter sp. TaxID=1945593 RepID=UPI00289890A3|nr:DUF4280 domain-containing protein [Oscillibacter sp.]